MARSSATERQMAARRREGERSTMSAATLNSILEQARDVNVELSPIAPTPRRWGAMLRADKAPLPEFDANPRAVVTGLAKHRPSGFIMGLITCVVGAVTSTLVPWAMGEVIDAGITWGFSPELGWMALLFLGIVTLVALADALSQFSEVSLWMTGDVPGKRLIARHISRTTRAVKRSHTTGDVVTATSDDVANIGELYTDIPELVGALGSIIVGAYIMLSTSVPLGLTILIGIPIVMGLLTLISRPLEQRQEAVREAQGELSTIITDAVHGLRILRGIGGEDAYAAAYERQSEQLRQRASKAALTAALLQSARIAAPLVLITIVVGQGIFLTFNGLLTPGQLLAFYGLTAYLRSPLWMWTRLIEHLAGARVGSRRIASILATQPLTSDALAKSSNVAPEATAPDWAKARLVADIDGQSFTMEPGQITALVSADPERGAAIARTFARTEDPSTLTVDGTPATEILLADLRANILLSEATPQLFAGTLRDALLGPDAPIPTPRGVTQSVWEYQIDVWSAADEGPLHSATNPADSSLHQALAWAHASDAVDSLRGLDGHLAEKGRNISGGQRQRLALARAYVADTPVLILVEPTSALDVHTEALIGKDLPQARAGRTTLIVTHSPLVAANADYVIVVNEHGNISAQGTYEQVAEVLAQTISQAKNTSKETQ